MFFRKRKEADIVFFKKENEALKMSDEATRRGLLVGFVLGVLLSVMVVVVFVL